MAAFKIFRKFADLLDRSTVDLPAINTPLADALAAKSASADLADVATSGSYADLSGTPTVPTTVAELTDRTTYDFATLNTPISNALGLKANAADLGTIATFAGNQNLATTDSPTFASLTATGGVSVNGITSSNTSAAAIVRVNRTDGKIGSVRAGGSTIGFDFDSTGSFSITPRLRATIEGTSFPADATGLTVLPSGYLGVNNAAPSVAFDVTGSAAISGNLTASGTVTAAGLTATGSSTGTVRISSLETALLVGDVIGKLEFYKTDGSTGGAGVPAYVQVRSLDLGGSFAMDFIVGSVSAPVTALTLGPSGTVTAGGATFNGLVSQTGLGGSTYFGEGAGIADDLSANNNVGIGFEALKSNTTGNYNTASGYRSLTANTTGSYNTSSGNVSLFNNTTGSYNTASGFVSLYLNTTGEYNTANGAYSLSSNTTGERNTATGYTSLYKNTTGSNNTAFGYRAGRHITGGSTENTTSGSSIYLGADTKALADGDANEIVIGYNATGAGSNTVTLGNASITKTVLRGAVETDGTVQTGAYTVGTLPTPSTGMRAYVTDSNRAANGHFGSAIIAAGGGTEYIVPVFYDGTNWIIA